MESPGCPELLPLKKVGGQLFCLEPLIPQKFSFFSPDLPLDKILSLSSGGSSLDLMIRFLH